MGSEDVVASSVDGGCVFEATEVAQDVCNDLSSFIVSDRAYRFLDCFACVCLSVCHHMVLGCVAV